MTQLAGSPLLPQPGRVGDLAKLPAHLPAIQGSTVLTAEDQPVILPCIARPALASASGPGGPGRRAPGLSMQGTTD